MTLTSISSSCVHAIKSVAMATYSNCFNKGGTGNHKQSAITTALVVIKQVNFRLYPL